MPTTEDIMQLVYTEASMWDGLFTLKASSVTNPAACLSYCTHTDPIIRCAATEVLADLSSARRPDAAISVLVDRLADEDALVRDNAARALIRIGPECVPALVLGYVSSDMTMRHLVSMVLLSYAEAALPFLRQVYPASNWVVANRIVDLVWRLLGDQSEFVLSEMLMHPQGGKTALLILSTFGTESAFNTLLDAYQYPHLRMSVLVALKGMRPADAHPKIFDVLTTSDDKRQLQIVKQLMVKLGKTLLPSVPAYLKKETRYRKRLIFFLEKIGAESIVDELYERASSDSILKQELHALFKQHGRI